MSASEFGHYQKSRMDLLGRRSGEADFARHEELETPALLGMSNSTLGVAR